MHVVPFVLISVHLDFTTAVTSLPALPLKIVARKVLMALLSNRVLSLAVACVDSKAQGTVHIPPPSQFL
jgi:hypothetical protein